MPLYYYLLILVVLSILFLVIRFWIMRQKNISVELFARALQEENSGHYEEAVVNYESALKEVIKIRYHGNLKNKIVEKIRLMRTVIDYQKSNRYKEVER